MSVRFAWSTRADGDLGGDLSARTAPLPSLGGAPRGWTWLRQVHGADLVVVERPGEHAGATADAALTASAGCVLAVRTADCAPVVLAGDRSVAILHLGWRSLVAGLVGVVADAMRGLGDAPRAAHLGPCIRAGCYEFAGPELDTVTRRFGAEVAATTSDGRPALDLAAAVAVAVGEQRVDQVLDYGGCTACDPRWYSHRAGGDTARFATVAWLEGESS